jgi:N-acetylglutamate synthase-like GNAT family acetyltransferase
MEIVDLTGKTLNSFLVCLEDWSDEMKDAGNRKALWVEKMKTRGLRVKLALVNGEAGGMIQYVPIEHAFAEGKDLYFIHCIWVHGYRGKGVGNLQKQGIGKALLRAAEEDVRALGGKGLVAWGLSLPIWMRASWFKRQGYRKVDRNGMAELLWKPFAPEAEPPRWIRPKKKPGKESDKVAVTGICNGWCPGQNIVFERAKRAAAEFGDDVVFREVDTFDRTTYLEWGMADALFIDGKAVRTGPPPSYAKIRKKIGKRVKRK